MTIDIAQLKQRVDHLIAAVEHDGATRCAGWADRITRPGFHASATNLAHYLALRRHDLRPLQRALMALGLSSLGRLESRVLPTLQAVSATLAALCGEVHAARPSSQHFFAGEHALARRSHELFGTCPEPRTTALLVTCPTEAADDPVFLQRLAERGVEAVRINCAHDDAEHWQRMIINVRAAEQQVGRRIKVLMDIAGPKIRTGKVRAPDDHDRIGSGDLLAIVPEGGLDRVDPAEAGFAVECTLPEPLRLTPVGARVFVDDGKLCVRIEKTAPWGLLGRVTAAADKGVRLKREKGLNFPDTKLQIEALTAKDRRDLDFVAAHADGVEFSFVQSVADVEMLQDALAQRRPDDWRTLSLILKIETPTAVAHLPEIVVQAAGQQPTAIMIARGDLAVEIGFARLAEMQEEILWIGEAAHIPVIWATQVLETLVKKGTPSRGEMTDAAMAARAECVMLNKGPYLFKAITELDTLLQRMGANQHKKTPQLRRLMSWA
ncbi:MULTISPECIES: pyruvate kinase [Rhodopseudomonas]|uniref:Pyruvate kinase n=1 Tax=Rhodopseudomonas palustris TaxID=1076 RepID=A0A0D7EKY0_RHOPL|nr:MULTISPECIES: pyruvate kinase [Rhodopseudomonas]KIZ41468.1 pyruvate kinase [Rhodopseudomonas palustris]MDF3812430.1 pyruvate kinase [Rhodopseudomonas sp. BAL398]WOK19429.1 pyruvate kinase [Rhodopseudomonas sp. BAL398]